MNVDLLFAFSIRCVSLPQNQRDVVASSRHEKAGVKKGRRRLPFCGVRLGAKRLLLEVVALCAFQSFFLLGGFPCVFSSFFACLI